MLRAFAREELFPLLSAVDLFLCSASPRLCVRILRRVGDNPVAAVALGAIEGLVGAMEKFLG